MAFAFFPLLCSMAALTPLVIPTLALISLALILLAMALIFLSA